MHHHFQTQCTNFNVTWETWTTRSSVATPKANIFVTIELTQLSLFKEYVATLHTRGKLARIIVDEVHLVLTHASFREIMTKMTWLGPTGPQIILQTATLPPTLQDRLFSTIGLTTCQVVRGKTCRTNIAVSVVKCHAESIDLMVKQTYDQALNASKEGRVMIFCRSKAKVEEIAALLNISGCHSDLPKELVDLVLDNLYDGTERGVVTTSLLGVAVDVPNVTHVIHVDYPYDIVSYVQEAGRAGRDPRSQAWSWIIIPEGIPKRKNREEGEDLFGRSAIQKILQDDQTCRRLAIQHFLDGVSEPCSMVTGYSHLCDVCGPQSSKLPDRQESSLFPWSKLQVILDKPLPQPPQEESFHSSTLPPPSSIHLQMATDHAARHQPAPFLQQPLHADLSKVHILMQRLALACVACWLHRDPNHQHLLDHCPRRDSPNDGNADWLSWKKMVDAERIGLVGVCYSCACPQNVSRIVFYLIVC